MSEMITVTIEPRHSQFGNRLGDQYVITIGRFRAVLPKCECENRTPCAKRDGHSVKGNARERDEHYRIHCHNYHDGAVERFIREVAATVGARSDPPRTIGVVSGKFRYRWYEETDWPLSQWSVF